MPRLIEPRIPGHGFSVMVDANELVVDSGKKLPYPTWIGFIDCNGRIDVWSPAAYKPRGYRAAARRMLEEMRDEALARCASEKSTRKSLSGLRRRKRSCGCGR